VFTLRTIGDAQAIREAGGQGKKALVMGGSFIGAEVAASLNQLGSEVTMIFPEARLLEMIVPEEMSEYLHSLYEDRGVQILSGTIAEKLVGNGDVSKAILDNGDELGIDLVVMGVGIDLNTELAQDAGLDIREKDQAVIVNEYLQTSDPDIYAAGDIAAWPDATFDKRLQVEHWDVARRQGMLAGGNMAGEKSSYSALPYFFSDLFDLSFEAWGNLSSWEKTVRRGSIESGSFAHFYFDDDDRMVGVIAVGRPDDERIPMQSLVEERASFQKFADKLRNEDIKLSQLTAEDSESEDRETEVTISFEDDIRPLFRESDIKEMIEISGFDLSDYDDVRERADGIYARLADGTMPCDQAWPDEQVEKFKRWMESGFEV
jgi:NADPH-dependent 2,4-dienoyl-CoA reductase/sulfur reductase-like enzyme